MSKKAVSKGPGRVALQRELGELGEVLPYMFRGAGALKAPGWYARVKGRTIYLGGYVGAAYMTIGELRSRQSA